MGHLLSLFSKLQCLLESKMHCLLESKLRCLLDSQVHRLDTRIQQVSDHDYYVLLNDQYYVDKQTIAYPSLNQLVNENQRMQISYRMGCWGRKQVVDVFARQAHSATLEILAVDLKETYYCLSVKTPIYNDQLVCRVHCRPNKISTPGQYQVTYWLCDDCAIVTEAKLKSEVHPNQ